MSDCAHCPHFAGTQPGRLKEPCCFCGEVPEGATFWNGEPARAERVRVIIADDPRFPEYWARDLVGTERDAVAITVSEADVKVGVGANPEHVLDPTAHTFYIDDEGGLGWRKVTEGRGSPQVAHRSLSIEAVL